MAVKFQFRRDTAANWATNNPILSEGEFGLDLTNQRFKIGDGVNTWDNIEFSQYTNKAETFSATLTIGGSGGTSDWVLQQSGDWNGLYIATKTVTGILTTDTPLVELDLSSATALTYDALQGDFGKMFRTHVSGIGEMKFYAKDEPVEDLPILIKVVR